MALPFFKCSTHTLVSTLVSGNKPFKWDLQSSEIYCDLNVHRDKDLGSCEPNNQLNVCTTSVTEGEVARVKLV